MWAWRCISRRQSEGQISPGQDALDIHEPAPTVDPCAGAPFSAFAAIPHPLTAGGDVPMFSRRDDAFETTRADTGLLVQLNTPPLITCFPQ